MTSDLYDELSGNEAPLSIPERVLTIGAHPDDAEFGAGAALARWADAGAEVSMLIVTDEGLMGSRDRPDRSRSEAKGRTIPSGGRTRRLISDTSRPCRW